MIIHGVEARLAAEDSLSDDQEFALLLAPSRDRGGGIERYVSSIEAAFSRHHVPFQRLNLTRPGQGPSLAAKLDFTRKVRLIVRTSDKPVRLVVSCLGLLPVVYTVARHRNFAGATVILHGTKCLSRRPLARRAMRRPGVRVLAVSNFIAGYAARVQRASILYPAIAPDWYHTLVAAGDLPRELTTQVQLVTAMRFAAWREKGLDRIVEAVRGVGDARIRLTICGSGDIPPELQTIFKKYPWIRVVRDPDSRELAAKLASADVFIHGSRRIAEIGGYGEGFGIVLVEAQLAGTPVITPAVGGSYEAMEPNVTGIVPADETTEALRQTLATLIHDPDRLVSMGRAAAAWARSHFEPGESARRTVETLLNTRVPLSR